jgi:sarcosine oxidase subunit beta
MSISSKIVVCRCEDVTLVDLEQAIADGYLDIEEVKRFTGLGTGPCQGKECLVPTCRLLAQARAAQPDRAQRQPEAPVVDHPFTARPPVYSLALGLLARSGEPPAAPPPAAPAAPARASAAAHPSPAPLATAVVSPAAPAAAKTRPAPASPAATAPRRGFPASASRLAAEGETVIIGGGIMGLGIAYQLARRGRSDVHVIEASYLASGASGRNGGGVRMQWSTELNIRLMQESIELCRHFAGEMGFNVWLRQGGYLFLARTAAEQAAMERNVALQNRCGVPTRMLDAKGIRRVVPELELGGIIAGCYNPRDGVVFPWPFLWGYAHRAAELGVQIHTYTRLLGIEPTAGGFVCRTSRGTIRAARVINAAGAWSPAIARMVGIELPNRPHRHEILSTEPLKPFLAPLVSLLSSGLYFSQSMRGEIVGGITVPDDKHGVQLGSRLLFLETIAKDLVAVMPRLAGVKVVRQWAGPYDVSPDGYPILGEPDGLPGFYLACGFVGHGFMMAPVIAQYYADLLCGGARHPIFDRCRLSRFAAGTGDREEMIIG